MKTPTTDEILARLGLTISGAFVDQMKEVETVKQLVERLTVERDEARATACRLEEELAKRPPL